RKRNRRSPTFAAGETDGGPAADKTVFCHCHGIQERRTVCDFPPGKMAAAKSGDEMESDMPRHAPGRCGRICGAGKRASYRGLFSAHGALPAEKREDTL